MTANTLKYSSAFTKLTERVWTGKHNRTMERLVARFHLGRRAYSFLESQREYFSSNNAKKNLQISPKSLFEEVSAKKYVDQIRQEGVAFGINLPTSMVDEIYQYACTAPCYGTGTARDEGDFLITDVKNGYLREKHPIALAELKDSTLMGCQAINNLVEDPLLLEVARNYLGYWPTKILRYMSWTLVSSLPDEQQKRLNEPVIYHYDIPSYNSVRIYFYITDVDTFSGPHIMIKNSHDIKPVKMLFSPCQQTDNAIYNYYGKEKEIIIEGNRGFGFFQDPYCFHKATTPVNSDRLLLQIRYF